MIKSIKAAAVFAVTALVFAMPLAAQNAPALPDAPAVLESNTLKASAGLFTSEVDDSMDVHYFSGDDAAEDSAFEKWAGFVGYGGSVGFNPISLGYATRFGSIYLGTWYTGNIASSDGIKTQTVTQNFYLPSQLQTSKVKETVYDSFMSHSNNQLEVLLGVAGMGFKVGFWESMYKSKNSDGTTTVTEIGTTDRVEYTNVIDEYINFGGHLMPSLTWGMSLDAGSLTIRPKVSAAFDIYQEKYLLKVKDTYTTAGGTLMGDDPALTSEGTNNGYFRPEFFIGAYIDLPSDEENGVSSTIDVGYSMGFNLYNNDYNVFGFKGSTKGTVGWSSAAYSVTNFASNKTTEAEVDFDFNEQTAWDHVISVGFYMDKLISVKFWSHEDLVLGLYAALPFGISTNTSETYKKAFSTTKVEYNNPGLGMNNTTNVETDTPRKKEKTTVLSLSPTVSLGAKYAMFPGRFSLNAGISMAPFTYTNTVTRTSIASNETVTKTQKVDDNGNVIEQSVTASPDPNNPNTRPDQTTDGVSVQNEWGIFEAGLFGGFVFNFNENAAIDMVIGGSFSNMSEFTLNIPNVSMLFTVKF
jgi:hypothetical protein